MTSSPLLSVGGGATSGSLFGRSFQDEIKALRSEGQAFKHEAERLPLNDVRAVHLSMKAALKFLEISHRFETSRRYEQNSVVRSYIDTVNLFETVISNVAQSGELKAPLQQVALLR